MVGRGLAIGMLLASAVGAANVAGDWKGSVSTQGQTFPVIFHLTEKAGVLGGTMDSPNQPGASGIPVDSGRLRGNSVQIGVSKIKGTFRGTLGKDGSMVGTWRQGASLPLTLTRSKAAGAAPAGDWQGTLDAGGAKLRLLFHVTGAGARLGGTMDSLDQNAMGIPLGAGSLSGSTLKLTIPRIGGEFTGTVAKGGTSVKGLWWQGLSLPLTLKRGK
jgi:hypothetical protein